MRTRRRGYPQALTLAAVAILLAACGRIADELTPDTATGSSSVFYKDLDDVDVSGPFRYALNVGADPRDVYLVFTNPTLGDLEPPALQLLSVNGGAPTQSHLQSFGPLVSSDSRSLATGNEPRPHGFRGPSEFLEWEPGTSPRSFPGSANLVPGPEFYVPPAPGPGPGEYSLGSVYQFYDANLELVDATLAVRNENVATANGPKTVEIWVASDEYSGGVAGNPAVNDDTANPFDVTRGMAQELANAFLSSPTGDDIYHWISEVFGAEWSAGGSPPYTIGFSELIDGQDTITILLYPILFGSNDTRGPGGVVGFFWSKDNYANEPVSNRRIMFYLDSDSYAFPCNPGEPCNFASLPSWEIEDSWPNDIVSTLAHEFQHMINFHERVAARGVETDLWLNELMSLVAEDFVEYERTLAGPRGVDPRVFTGGAAGNPGNVFGRLPLYNAANSVGLADWGGSGDVLESYSLAYAFGAYLARNYGGARFFEELMQSGSELSEQMITDAILAAGGSAGVTMEALLMQWGAAVVLSDDSSQSAPTRLNSGGWLDSSSEGGEPYRLGSINHFLYTPELAPAQQTGLRVVSTSPLPAYSKLIYRVGSGLTGTIDLEITAAQNMDFAVVVK